MGKLKKWLYIFLGGAAWVFLYRLFLHLESNVEPSMMANGLASHWWYTVLLYWISDTIVVVSLAYIVARPFGLRMPAQFPFFQFGGDLAVLVLIVHIAWLCTDHYLYAELTSVGLAALSQLFIFIGAIWAVVAFLRFRQLTKMVNRLPQDEDKEAS